MREIIKRYELDEDQRVVAENMIEQIGRQIVYVAEGSGAPEAPAGQTSATIEAKEEE